MKFATVAALLTLSATALPASATSWEPLSINDTGAPVRITATGENGLSAVLVCNDKGKVTAVLATEEIDLNNALRSVPRVKKQKSGELVIGESDPYRLKLIHWSSRDVLITRKHTEGAKIFNAVVRGDGITIKLNRGDEFSYDLPRADGTFANFAKACSASKVET